MFVAFIDLNNKKHLLKFLLPTCHQVIHIQQQFFAPSIFPTFEAFGNTGGLSLIMLWWFYLSINFFDTATWKIQMKCKMHVKSKIFDWYLKNYNILLIFTLFQLLSWSLFLFLKISLWFHISEDSPVALVIFAGALWNP